MLIHSCIKARLGGFLFLAIVNAVVMDLAVRCTKGDLFKKLYFAFLLLDNGKLNFPEN